MISGVSSTNAVSNSYQAKPAPGKPVAKTPAKPAEDSVHLSHAAKGAGDVDHDGDSK